MNNSGATARSASRSTRPMNSTWSPTSCRASTRHSKTAAQTDKFAEGAWADGLGGAPVLAGCAAVFECQVEHRHEVGDHVLFIGRVLRLADLAVAPLLFQGGHYRMLGEVL